MRFCVEAIETLLLALRELEARASALLSVLLALFLSRISRQVTSSLEHRSLTAVELLDRSGDSVAQRAGLARDSPTGKRRVDVVATQTLGLVEGRAHHDLERSTREVFVHLSAIHGDFPGTECEADASDRALALTRGLDRTPGGL